MEIFNLLNQRENWIILIAMLLGMILFLLLWILTKWKKEYKYPLNTKKHPTSL